MLIRNTLMAVASAVALIVGPGCAVVRDQSTVGEYVDDATITTRVKARFAQDPVVSAAAINVETLNGTVQLSGFAKNSEERAMAESIARNVAGVKAVQNAIAIRS